MIWWHVDSLENGNGLLFFFSQHDGRISEGDRIKDLSSREKFLNNCWGQAKIEEKPYLVKDFYSDYTHKHTKKTLTTQEKDNEPIKIVPK